MSSMTDDTCHQPAWPAARFALKPAGVACDADRVDAVARTELAHRVGQVVPHGRGGEEQGRCDLARRAAVGGRPQNVGLTLGERTASDVERDRDERWGEEALALCDAGNLVRELLRRRVLSQEAADPCLERAGEVPRVAEAGKDQHARL